MSARASLVVALAVAACAGFSCGDPAHDDAVSALGGEAPDVGPGPRHRPGQPCVVCHGGSGPGKTHFSIAGTVFGVKGQTAPLAGATLQLTDAAQSQKTLTSNSAGNFYVAVTEWDPVAPINVSVVYGNVTAKMNTHIGRDGSCAACHFDPPGPTSAGRVFLVSDAVDLPAGP